MKIFVTTAIFAIFLFAMTSVLTKFLINRIGGPFRFLTIQVGFGAIITTITLVVSGIPIINPALARTNIALQFGLSILFAYFGFITLMIGFSKGNASVGGIFLSSRLIINIPLAAIFLHEIYPPLIYVFIAFGLFGALITTWEEGMNISDVLSIRANGVFWYVSTMVFWALSNLFVTGISDALHPIQFISYRYLIFVVVNLILYPFVQPKFDKKELPISRSFLYFLAPYVIFTVSAQFLFVFSLQQSLTITEGIGAAEGVVTFVIALIVAKFISNKELNEPLESRVLRVRSGGVILSLLSIVVLTIIT